MNEFRVERTDNEKIANKVVGIDAEATHFVVNGESADEILKRQKAAKFNQEVGDLQERFQGYIDAVQEAGKQVAANLQDLEIMPLTSYALVVPFSLNPFQKVETSDSGIITDLGGMNLQHKSQETGDMEDDKVYTKVGIVHEVGAECKFLQPGDIVFYNAPSENKVPFFKFGFVMVAEQRILAVVNEGLTKRRNEIRDNRKADV